MISLTKSLGEELAGYDIAVNAISPATAKTRILDTLKPEFIQYMLSRIPAPASSRWTRPPPWSPGWSAARTTASVFDLSGGRCTY